MTVINTIKVANRAIHFGNFPFYPRIAIEPAKATTPMRNEPTILDANMPIVRTTGSGNVPAPCAAAIN